MLSENEIRMRQDEIHWRLACARILTCAEALAKLSGERNPYDRYFKEHKVDVETLINSIMDCLDEIALINARN